jgi:hypothetical protein
MNFFQMWSGTRKAVFVPTRPGVRAGHLRGEVKGSAAGGITFSRAIASGITFSRAIASGIMFKGTTAGAIWGTCMAGTTEKRREKVRLRDAYDLVEGLWRWVWENRVSRTNKVIWFILEKAS